MRVTKPMKISFEIPDRDERGVSPVIGVILMVTITVILAAVIASFVLGFGDSVSENVQAGADISQTDDGNASVTWISEGNAVNLSVSTTSADTNATDGVNLAEVGDTVKVYNIEEDSVSTTITVTAYGEGGAQTVVTQEDVTLTNATA